MKIIGILLFIVTFVKIWDQTIIQIIRKSNFFHRDLSKTIATSEVKFFVALVYGLQPSTNVTENSILGVAGVLDLPLEFYSMF